MNNLKHQTIDDIAAELGLDRSTVSCILNDRWKKRRIAERTARRVKDYVKKVGFHQDISALSMRGKHSVDVAIIIRSDLYLEQHAIYFRLMEFLNNSSLNYVTLFFHDKNQGRFCQELKANNPKKIVVFSYFLLNSKLKMSWKQIHDSFLKKVPCYYHYAPSRNSIKDLLKTGDSASVIAGNDHRIHEVFEFLRSKGIQKIFMDQRSMAHVKENTPQIVAFNINDYPVDSDHFHIEKLTKDGENIAREILKNEIVPGKTALMIHDEYCAVACMDFLRKNNVKIPEDIVIVSGAIMEATRFYDYPRLYWQYPFEQMYQAMRNWLEGKSNSQKLFEITTELKKSSAK